MDYTQCTNMDNPSETCDAFVANAIVANATMQDSQNTTCTCRLELAVTQELRAPVHVRSMGEGGWYGVGVIAVCVHIHQ